MSEDGEAHRRQQFIQIQPSSLGFSRIVECKWCDKNEHLPFPSDSTPSQVFSNLQSSLSVFNPHGISGSIFRQFILAWNTSHTTHLNKFHGAQLSMSKTIGTQSIYSPSPEHCQSVTIFDSSEIQGKLHILFLRVYSTEHCQNFGQSKQILMFIIRPMITMSTKVNYPRYTPLDN